MPATPSPLAPMFSACESPWPSPPVAEPDLISTASTSSSLGMITSELFRFLELIPELSMPSPDS